MPAQQQGQGSGNDNSLDFLWLIAMIVVGIGLLWYFGHQHITKGVYFIRYYEIAILLPILKSWNFIASLLSLPLTDVNTLITWQQAYKANLIASDFNSMQAISTDVGKYYRYLGLIVLPLLAYFLYKGNIGLKFQMIYDMKKLRQLEYRGWPQIAPILKVDLVKQDINEGPWAMSMTPMQFCKHHELIIEERDENEKLTAKLNRGKAQNLFILQLGHVWQDAFRLPIHRRALIACFAAAANNDRASAEKLLSQISLSSETDKFNFDGADALLNKHISSKIVQRVIQKHAYVLTVMASLLELARTDGVFACSEFLWLKPVDRVCWYMMNSVGRQTAVAEVAGPYAHWKAEQKIGHALQMPMVDEAVNGLEIALGEILYEVTE